MKEFLQEETFKAYKLIETTSIIAKLKVQNEENLKRQHYENQEIEKEILFALFEK